MEKKPAKPEDIQATPAPLFYMAMRKTYFYIDEQNNVRDARGKRIRPDKTGRYWIRAPKQEEPSEEELMFYWWRFVVLLFYPVFWVRDVVLAVFGKASYFERRIETMQSFQGYLKKHEDTLNP